MPKKPVALDDLDLLTATAFLMEKGYKSEIEKCIALGDIMGYKMRLTADELIGLLVEYKNQ
jgi:hypothetical protein